MLGEIAGTVVLKRDDGTQIAEGVDIILRDKNGKQMSSLKSEFDGFFVFPSLRMGTYTLEIPESYLEQYGIGSPIQTVVSLTGDQSIMDQVVLEINLENAASVN